MTNYVLVEYDSVRIHYKNSEFLYKEIEQWEMGPQAI